MNKNKPLILVVNDDGISSPGIILLTSIMREIGEVYVVAPQHNCSGYSHAMTLNQEISVYNINTQKHEFACSGTPVDCVKLAFNKILPYKPDLCVSGINHGSNHSINGWYSGTLHAAMEATIQGVPSISFSHLSYDNKKSLNSFKSIISSISKKVLKNNCLDNITLNINFPDTNYSNIKGLRLCVPAKGVWREDFQLIEDNDLEKKYLISGKFNSDKTNLFTDSWALDNNFISIVPVSLYPQSKEILSKLKFLENVF